MLQINIIYIYVFRKIPCKKSDKARIYLSGLVLLSKLLTAIMGDTADMLFGLKTIPLERFYLI